MEICGLVLITRFIDKKQIPYPNFLVLRKGFITKINDKAVIKIPVLPATENYFQQLKTGLSSVYTAPEETTGHIYLYTIKHFELKKEMKKILRFCNKITSVMTPVS